MPPVRSLPLAIAGAAALLACAGCGEGAPVALRGRTLRLTLSEYRIAPQAVRVQAGTIAIVVRNAGTTVHRLQVRTSDRTRTLASSPPLRPGASARLTVDLPPGRYVDSCPLERHDTLGEHGTIEVS